MSQSLLQGDDLEENGIQEVIDIVYGCNILYSTHIFWKNWLLQESLIDRESGKKLILNQG